MHECKDEEMEGDGECMCHALKQKRLYLIKENERERERKSVSERLRALGQTLGGERQLYCIPSKSNFNEEDLKDIVSWEKCGGSL